ncbi:probable inactive poly [ADP-ribose] polymerase SRO2 isoform X2 [Aristolochia californica]|uniref:probable inactive poly [ADP-ribose] polymerase SRO2 isoform X2 n=1 Tax=Aristolochia californica TaxID=171875 RepID=UPI0035E149B1
MDVGVGLTGERYSSSQFFFRRNSESNISGPGTSSEHVDIEASASGSTGEQEVSFPQRNNEMETSASDSESNVSDSRPMKSGFFGDKMMTLDDDDKHHNSLQRFFLSGMGSLAKNTTVVAIHRNTFSASSAKARLQSFRIYSDVTAKKRGGKINMKCAWYGASKDEIRGILNHGFGLCERPENGALFGSGVYLSPASSSQDGIISSVVDESGLRHVLLCRVILGDVEEVGCGSKQFHPSSEEFDSGVDNLSTPKRYIIWSTHMNTHILPEFVISFRGLQCLKQTVKKPTSAWMPFPKLIGLLSEFLPPNEINLIKLYFNDYQAKKITREHMIKRVRLIAGDKLLASVIKSFRSKNPIKKF